MAKEPYEIYVIAYGKAQTGKVFDDKDYGEVGEIGWEEYDERGKLAVSLGAEDADNKLLEMRSKSQVTNDISKRLE